MHLKNFLLKISNLGLKVVIKLLYVEKAARINRESFLIVTVTSEILWLFALFLLFPR